VFVEFLTLPAYELIDREVARPTVDEVPERAASRTERATTSAVNAGRCGTSEAEDAGATPGLASDRRGLERMR
jgi:hypothetical protein